MDPPRPDAPDGVQEVVHVRDPLLEQVPEAAAGLGHELQPEPRIHVLGQDQAAGGRRRQRADMARGAQPFVGECRRHPDVDDGDVGPDGLDQDTSAS